MYVSVGVSALFVLLAVCYGEISLACSQPGNIFMPSTRDRDPFFMVIHAAQRSS